MASLNILCAEEDWWLKLGVTKALEEQGLCAAGSSCEEELTRLEKVESDGRRNLLLLYNHLPGINGLELLRRPRSLPHIVDTPVTSATGFGTKACRAGGGRLLRKPENIFAIVEQIVKLTAPS